MKRPMFTPEELAEMAAFDAEVDAQPITMAEIAESRQRDKNAKLDALDHKARKLAERQREYYAANTDKFAEYQREYRAANKDKVAEYQREYYAANKDKVAERQREYRARKKAAAQGVMPNQ